MKRGRTVNLRLPEDLSEQIRRAGEATGLSRDGVMRLALDQGAPLLLQALDIKPEKLPGSPTRKSLSLK